MKRSAINSAQRAALACFNRYNWSLPPQPRWDITDFGLGDFARYGLTLVNLATEPEYCEKVMWARRGQTTPCHAHAKKKEDIICRVGELAVKLWPKRPSPDVIQPTRFSVPVDGLPVEIKPGVNIRLRPGSRVTLAQGIWHEFYPLSDECIIGEVSCANDDQHDNFFLHSNIGRFPDIEEDEPSVLKTTHRN